MSDSRDPRSQPAGDGELVSAYLDGELDGEAASEFEARLAAEPALAAQLEHTREVVETLAGLQAVPPPGYDERLRERLAAERADTAPGSRPDAGGDVASHAASTSLRRDRPGGDARPGGSRARERARARRWRGWTPLGAAAGVLLVAVLGGVLVLNAVGSMDLGEVATMEAGDDAGVAGVEQEEEEAAEEDSARLFADEGDDGEDGDAGVAEPEDAPVQDTTDEDVDVEPAPTGGAAQPALVEDGTVLDGEEAAREHLARSTAPGGVLGMELAPAEELAQAFRVAIQRAEPFSTGVAPDACLEDVLAGADAPAVPVEVEALVYEDRPALAYLVVTASAGAERLDRVEARVVDPDGCLTRLYLDVTSGR